MLRTTLTNLRARPFRVLATSMAVLLGVAFMAGTLVLTDTMGRSFDQLVEYIYEDTDAVVRGEKLFDTSDPWGTPGRALVDEALVDVVAGVDGVVAVYGSVEGYAQIIGSDGEPIGNPGMGAPTFGMPWPEDEQFNPMVMREGRPPEQGDEAVIDAGSAGTGNLSVGDTTVVLTASGPVPITIVGIAGWGDDADSPLGASITALTPQYAQEVLGVPGKVTAIQVAGDGSTGQDELRNRIAEAMPEGVEVLTGEEITAEEQGDIAELISFFGTFMLTFALIALFVGSFIIYNTFSILVAQRNREMALMRAIGASRGQVLGSLLLEAVVVGLIASVLGLFAGMGVAALLKGLLAALGMEVPAGGLVVSGGTVVAALVVGVVVTVGAAVIPARKASRIPPVAAMSDAQVGVSTRVKRRSIIGAAVVLAGGALLFTGLFGGGDNALLLVGVGAAVLFVGVAVLGPLLAVPVSKVVGAPIARFKGVTGSLARQNSLRNPKRTAATASALMIGVALVGFITIFAASARASLDEIIDRTFRGDFVIDSGTFGAGGFDPGLAAGLNDLPEVAAASGARISEAEVEGQVQYLFAVDPTTIDQIFDAGIVAGSLSELDAQAVGVWDERADDEGWSVGDTISLRFPETGVQDFRIAILFENRELVGTSFVMSTAAFDANLPVSLDTSVFVAIEPGVDSDTARMAIESLTDAYPTATVLDQTEWKEAQAASFNQLLGLVYVLLFLAIFIALLGIANTLALSILERTRELGLLRAVGMTRAQLRSTVRWESVIIALFGSLLGLVIGIFFGWALVRALAAEGLGTFTLPVTQLAVIVVLAALAGLVAAIVPARRAARLDVLRALATT
jgi:putative ABC transport system permease protein